MNQNTPEESALELCPREEDGFLYQPLRVLNPNGMHARPSAIFCDRFVIPNVEKFQVALKKEGESDFNVVTGMLDMMCLALFPDTSVELRVSCGSDTDGARELVGEIYAFFEKGFEE